MGRVGTPAGVTRVVRGGVQAALLTAIAITLAGCGQGGAFQDGNKAAMRSDWDLAVTHYDKAVASNPDRADYKMALERAQMAASQVHFEKARDYERQDQLDLALLEYRKVVAYHAANQEARAKIQTLEQTIRDRIEASRPKPPVEAMRQKARQDMEEPALNPASREPIKLHFPNRQLKEVLEFLRESTGINIAYDSGFQDRAIDVKLDGVTLEQALYHLLLPNGYYYKVLNPRSIIIVQDNPQKRAFYDEQAIQTFYLSNADATEVSTLLNQVVSSQTQGVRPTFAPNKNGNSITVRGTVPMLQMIERVIAMNDKPRAEVSVDVEILEVNRNRAKQYGLELSAYQVGITMSPETRPGGTNTDTSFNLNTISQGVSTADFYTSVPSAVIKFLESDTNTKVLAKPNLRGTEGEKLSVNLGEEIPVPNTTFYNSYGGAGVATTPMTSFQYKNVGVNVSIEKMRVSDEGDVSMQLTVEISAKGADVLIAGQLLPSFKTRKVESKIRLRDGESNLLAGLLSEIERKSLKGFPYVLRLPIIKQLFSSNDTEIQQTDIVMLLTPHIVRTHEMTQKDFAPVYIGTQQNLGITGPPPLIAPPGEAAAAAAAAPPAAPVTAPPASAPTLAGVPSTAVPTAPRGAPGIQPPPSSPVPTLTPPTQAPGAAPTAVAAGQPPLAPPATAQAPGQPPAPTQPPTPAPGQPPAAAQPVVPPQVSPVSTVPAAPAAPVRTGPAPAPELLRIAPIIPTVPMTVAGGPYTVPLNITGASRVSTVTLSLRYNPRVLRVRLVQEGTFMRQGGATVSFAQQADGAGGRIDITIVRTGDTTGAAGAGMLAAVVFDAVGSGESALGLGGIVATVGGAPAPVQFGSAAVTVK